VGGHHDFIFWMFTQAQIDKTALFHPTLRLKKIFDILQSVQYL